MRRFVFRLASFFVCSCPSFAETSPLEANRILFVGDSITHAGYYVDQFAAYLAVRYPERKFDVLNLGLPSETVSGLSEPGHADGKFPRPDLHERFDRVLERIKPDLVIACYGMNDGVYQPLDEERFGKFRDGIERLRGKAAASGARIIHLTPPVFDTTMRRILDARRSAEPGFTFAKDGVHPSEAAHWIFSMELVGDIAGEDRPAAMEWMNKLRDPAFATELKKLVRERGRILTDAWLHEIGHKRPGMAKGLPLEEAKARAAELDERIRRAAAAVPGAPRPKSI